MFSTKRKNTLAIVIVGVFVLVASTAFATTVLSFSWDQMAKRSNAIVAGTVIDSYSHWNVDKTKIYTTTTILVSDVFKGKVDKTVHIRQLGGEVDGIGAKLLGTPTFMEGENLLMFLEGRPDGAFVTVGLSQGKCQLLSQKSGVLMIKRSPMKTGVSVIQLYPDMPPDPTTILLDELLMIIDQQAAK